MFYKKTLLFWNLTLLILILTNGCLKGSQNAPEVKGGLDSASLSPDDRQILFSFYKNGYATIYAADVDGSNVKELASSIDYDYTYPIFSSDGSKIVFLGSVRHAVEPKSLLYLMDSSGKNIKPLTSKDNLITEAVFSPDNKKIYFLQSSYFGHYSPIARSHPHDFDIYSINVDGSELKRMTNFTAYEMEGLSTSSDGKSLLLKITDQTLVQSLLNISDEQLNDEETYSKVYHAPNPIIIINLNEINKLTELKLDQDKLKQLASDENRVTEAKYGVDVYNPTLSHNSRFLAFTTVVDYDLFIMSITDKNIKQLTNFKTYVHNIHFFNTQEKLIFIHDSNWPQNGPSRLMQINTDGSNTSEIILKVPGK